MNEDFGSCQECNRPRQADDVMVPLPIAGEERQVLLCNACRTRLSGTVAHQATLRKPGVRPC